MSAAQVQEVHLTLGTADMDALAELAQRTGLSKGAIKQAMRSGALWHTRGRTTQRLRRARRALQRGDELHLYYNPAVLAEAVQPARLVADHKGYSVWFKPYGMRCQGSKWGDHTTLVRWAETHLEPRRPAFSVHRLDRAARGLILLAHSKTMAAQLARRFAEREIDKRYQAWVHGAFPVAEQTLDAPIDGRAALSRARGLRYDPTRDLSLVEITIETGRKHQIRRHLADCGHPLVGDRHYGEPEPTVDLQLCAVALGFICPLEDRPLRFSVDEPWWDL